MLIRWTETRKYKLNKDAFPHQKLFYQTVKLLYAVLPSSLHPVAPSEDTPPSSERTTKMLSHKIYVVEPFFVFEPLTESASFSPTTKSFCKSFRSSLLVVHLRLNMLVDFGSGSSAASDGLSRTLSMAGLVIKRCSVSVFSA